MNTTEILIKIRKIVRSVDIESKKIQKEYGVSIPQVLCLNFLKSSTNFQATQSEIKKFLNLNASTVSGIINRLEKKGYLARLPKSIDKRVVNIVLTSDGYKALSTMPSLLHETLSKKLQQLNDKELTTVEEGLEILVKILEIEKVEASPLITTGSSLEEYSDEGGVSRDSNS
jgi:DNA-binding MarR family transcriptional regulator